MAMWTFERLKEYFEPLGITVSSCADKWGNVHTLSLWLSIPDPTKPPMRAVSAGKTFEWPTTKIVCSYEWKFGRHSTPHVTPEQVAEAVKSLKAQREAYLKTKTPTQGV